MTHLHDRAIPDPRLSRQQDTRGVNSPRRPLLQAVVCDPAANAGQRDNGLPSVQFQTLRNIFRADDGKPHLERVPGAFAF